MRMYKKTRAILMGTLIITLGIFTAGTDVFKGKNTYTASGVDNKAAVKESLEKAESIKPLEEIKKIEANQNTETVNNAKTVEKVDKPILNRGGSGVQKAQPKSQTKQQINTNVTVKKSTSSTIVNEERDLFARLVSAEAEGESFEGQLAVATVIINRVKSPNYPNTIKGVILDKAWGYQFTPVADGRINLPASASSKKAVDMVLGGYRSFEPKVMFFLNPKKSVSPYITNNKTYYKTIGNHDFYY